MTTPLRSMTYVDALHAQLVNYPDWLARQVHFLDTLLPCGANGGYGALCSDVTRQQCDRWLSTLCASLLVDFTERFVHEDRAMLGANCSQQRRERFEEHVEAHGDLMEHLVEVIQSASPCTVRSGLRDLLQNRFAQHLQHYDADLLNWPGDSVVPRSALADGTSPAPPTAAGSSERVSSSAP